MKVKESLLQYCCIMAIGAVNVACHHHDLIMDGSSDGIMILNDWNYASDASPEGMAYLFFPDGDVEPWRFDFPGRTAGKVKLPNGDYRFVMFNDDTSQIKFVIDSAGGMYASAEVCTLNTVVDVVDYDGQPVKKAPDKLWCYSVEHVSIRCCYLEYGNKKKYDNCLITYPRQVTPSYSLKINHVENLHGVAWMAGAITGQSDKIDLNDYSHDGPLVTVPFGIDLQPDSTLTSDFLTYGTPSGIESDSKIVLFFMMSDGEMVKISANVTDQIRNSLDPMDIKLVIDSIQLPWAPPIEIGGGGFVPTVNGWVDVVIDYGTN